MSWQRTDNENGDEAAMENRLIATSLTHESQSENSQLPQTNEEIEKLLKSNSSEECPRPTLTPPALRSSGVRVGRGQRRLILYSSKNPKETAWLEAEDIECLKFLGEQGTGTLNQIIRAMRARGSVNKSSRYFYRREKFWSEQRLVQKNWIRGERHGLISLTERGRRKISEVIGTQVPIPPSPAEILHTLSLTEFRIAAESAGRVKNWISDRFIPLAAEFPRNRLSRFHPDALWTTKTGSRILIEYERTPKTRKRRLEKAQAFDREMRLSDRFMDRVIWIADEESLSMVTEVCAGLPEQFVFTVCDFLAELEKPASKETSK